jgi:hypothetical protein
MRIHESNEDRAVLHAVLKEWKPPAALPPRFQEQVWRRIERAETAKPFRSNTIKFANWMIRQMMKPAPATAYVMALLVVGAGMGWGIAQQKTERVSSELSMLYAQSVDPYQAIQQQP